MTVQWTVHIPQAMQRHGGSVRPCAGTARETAILERVQQAAAQSDMPPAPPAEADKIKH
jgi:hypothetical protein